MRNALLLVAVLAALAPVAFAADVAPSATAVICTGVKDRAPQGVAEKFAAAAGQLYCFSEVRGVADKVVHVWFHADKQLASVELPVKAQRWRTWSGKKLPAGAAGGWRVEVRDTAGKVLATASFTVE
jgi:hypothetical protein